MDALLTDGCSRMSYSALRSLSSLGLGVVVADTTRAGMGQWSKYSKGSFVYSSPVSRPWEFMRDINWILKTTGARFLLPGYDETEVLAKYRTMLPGDVVLPVADYESIRLANDKSRIADFARGLGIPVPETFVWKTMNDLEKKLRAIEGKVVVKLRRGSAARGVFYPENVKDTLDLCRRLAFKYKLGLDRLPFVQKRVTGEKWSVASLYHHGREISTFTQRMLRENPSTGGTSTYRVSVRNEKLEGYARTLLDALNWHGIAHVEFKYDPAGDEAWFIEVNPRLWGAISHSVAAGADFVALLYIASTEGVEKALMAVEPYRVGVSSRWLLGEASLALSELRRMRPVNAFRLMLGSPSDDYDEFKKDDIGALIGQFAYFLGRHIRAGWGAPLAERSFLG